MNIYIHTHTHTHTHTHIILINYLFGASMVSKLVKNRPTMQETSSIPWFGKSSGEGNGNPLQYAFLGNLLDRGAWWATVHRVAKVKHNLALATTPPPLPLPFLSLFLAVLDLHCVRTYSSCNQLGHSLPVVRSLLNAVASFVGLLWSMVSRTCGLQ